MKGYIGCTLCGAIIDARDSRPCLKRGMPGFCCAKCAELPAPVKAPTQQPRARKKARK